MSYTLNRGVKNEGMDNTQRGLLIGLPLIALLLSFGAIHRHNSDNKVSASSSTIPVVSSLNGNGKSAGGDSNTNNSDNNPGAAPGIVQNGTGMAPTFASGAALIGAGGTTSSTPSPTGTTPPIVGGMGGGPTGGGGTGGGGPAPLPNCSIGQIATVNCMVPACAPPVSLSAGQKAILGLNGACIVVN